MVIKSFKFATTTLPPSAEPLTAHEATRNRMLFTTERQLYHGRYVKYYIRGHMIPRLGLLFLLADGGLVLEATNFPYTNSMERNYMGNIRSLYVTYEGLPMFNNITAIIDPITRIYFWRFPVPGEQLLELIT